MSGIRHEQIYTHLSRLGKALSNPVRLRLLDQLDGRELTVEQLAQLSGTPVKNTSAQLQELRSSHLVTSRKDGTRVHYRLADEEVSRFLAVFHSVAEHRLADLRSAITEEFGDAGSLEPVTAQELGARLDHGVLVVDVRSFDDYQAGHLPQAVSLPSEGLLDRLGELPRDADIVAYCRGPYCVTSAESVRLLREHGLNARHLKGGYLGWHRSGQPVERGGEN